VRGKVVVKKDEATSQESLRLGEWLMGTNKWYSKGRKEADDMSKAPEAMLRERCSEAEEPLT